MIGAGRSGTSSLYCKQLERFVAFPQEQILVIASEQWSIWREAETLAKPKV